MPIVPTAGRCIVKRSDAEQVTKGGIHLPDSAKEKPLRGKVLAVGKGKLLDNGTYAPVELQEGTEVYFGRYAGSEIPDGDGDTLLVMLQEDVIAAVE